MKKVKKLYIENGTNPFLFQPEWASDYPIIEGNESNFVTDYNIMHQELDRYFAKTYGNMVWEGFEEDSLEEWNKDVAASFYMNLVSWARMYYALSLSYNPLYNVDGTTEHIYSDHEIEDEFGERHTTFEKGSQENTLGNTETNSTQYETAYDSLTEKETGKSTTTEEEVTNTDGERTDETTDDSYTNTRTDKRHTETEIRQGNIGVTKSTELLESEFAFRKMSFFKEVFKTLARDLGLRYTVLFGGE